MYATGIHHSSASALAVKLFRASAATACRTETSRYLKQHVVGCGVSFAFWHSSVNVFSREVSFSLAAAAHEDHI